MTFNDEQFEELVKKANRKRNRKSFFISILTVFSLVFLGVGGYMWYMNYGPFQGNSVSGVPDGHIRILNEQTGPLSLIFDSYGGYAFNAHGKEVNVYLAYYEKDVRIKHERVAGIESSEEWDINGTLYWGLTLEGGEPKELRVNIQSPGLWTSGIYDFTQLNLDTEKGFASTINAFSSGRIVNGRRYVLRTWQASGMSPADNDFFDEEVLRENSQTIILYLVFE